MFSHLHFLLHNLHILHKNWFTSFKKDSLAPHIGSCLLSISSSLAWGQKSKYAVGKNVYIFMRCYYLLCMSGRVVPSRLSAFQLSKVYLVSIPGRCLLKRGSLREHTYILGWLLKSLNSSLLLTLGSCQERRVFFHLISSSSSHLKSVFLFGHKLETSKKVWGLNFYTLQCNIHFFW